MHVFFAGSVAPFQYTIRSVPAGDGTQQQCSLSRSTAASVHPFVPVANLFDGTDLQEDDLREALTKHAECWTDDSIDPSIAAAEVCRRVTMGSEATAEYRIDAVHSRLEQYFKNPSAERVFRDTLGAYKRDPAVAVSKALVAGLQTPRVQAQGRASARNERGLEGQVDLSL